MAEAAEQLPESSLIVFNPEFMAVVADDETRHAASVAAQAQGWEETAVQIGNIEHLDGLVNSAQAPRLLVADLDGAMDPAGALLSLAVECGDRCGIVAVGSTNDVTLYRALKTAGAADYLVKPVTTEALLEALGAVGRASGTTRMPAREGQKQGKVVCVIGARGGVGASAMTVNSAWFLAHEYKKKTVILDLDLHFGVSSLALDLEPGHGLREALESPDRLDSLLLVSSLVNESDNLCILGGEEPLEQAIDFENAGIGTLFDELANQFDCVMVDMPRVLIPRHRHILAKCNDVYLVTDFTLPALRDCGRILEVIDGLHAGFTCHVVGSRIGKERSGQLDKATFQRNLKRNVEFVLPEDAKTFASAANAGKTVGEMARNAVVSKTFSRIAKDLAASEDKEPKKVGLLGKLKLLVHK